MKNNYLTHTTLLPAVATAIPYEEKELAILFLDIRNFTGLMVSQPEQHIIQIVRRLFTAFNQIIKSFSGKVIETAGDSLYAVFGLQDTLPEAVNNAYQATRPCSARWACSTTRMLSTPKALPLKWVPACTPVVFL
jgi:adenylate cyclase